MSASHAWSHVTVDDVAVQRRLDGDTTVRLTIAERRACVARLHAQGMNDRPIARRLGISDRTVLRIRKLLDLPANPKQLRPADHGDLLSYQRGCRCSACRAANAENCRRYTRRSA